MKPTQEQALREYLREAIIPLIEDVLVKKIGQGMTFAAEELKRSKKEWQELTSEEIIKLQHLIDWTAGWSYGKFARAIEAKLKEKNND
jgi:predicted RNase H-like nuclease (RuvC/YqgF family)